MADAPLTSLLLQRVPTLERKDGQKIIGKVDLNVIPFIFLAVFFIYVDRASVVLLGSDLCASLGLHDEEYRAGNLLFMVGLLVFQVPSNMVLERVHAGRYIGGLLATWGLVALLSFLATNAVGFYVSRFVLGAVEAGIVPGLWYYCTLFYPEYSLVLPFTVVEVGRFSASFLSIPFSSYIHDLGGSLEGWQWVMISEGCCAIIVGVVLFFTMPGSLSDCYFLSLRDARWVTKELRGSIAPDKPGFVAGPAKLVQQCRGVLLCGGLWACAAVKFGSRMSSDLLYHWAPAIISNHSAPGALTAKTQSMACESEGDKQGYGVGFTDVWAYAAIPYGVAFFGAFIVATTSMRYRERKHHAAWLLCGTAVSLYLLVIVSLSDSWAAVFTFLAIALVGVLSAGGPIVALASSFLSTSQKAVGLAGLSVISQLGGYVGVLVTNALISDHKTYTNPMLVVASLLVVSVLITLTLPDPIKMKKKPLLAVDLFMDDFSKPMKSTDPPEELPISQPIVPPASGVLDPPPAADVEKEDLIPEKIAYATVVYAFEGELDGELTVGIGEVVEVIGSEKDGWVYVRRDEDAGIIPVAYLEFEG
ncbi:hypothetical protein BSKO_06042 [Bryopsis sp. KO-2023]|nr:hypothetical protein BSKO_06042 [Bryopsis sp. KO-2023]